MEPVFYFSVFSFPRLTHKFNAQEKCAPINLLERNLNLLNCAKKLPLIKTLHAAPRDELSKNQGSSSAWGRELRLADVFQQLLEPVEFGVEGFAALDSFKFNCSQNISGVFVVADDSAFAFQGAFNSEVCAALY